MKKLISILVITCLIPISCNSDSKDNADKEQTENAEEIVFNKEKWNYLEGRDYPYREKMLTSIVHSDSVRLLVKTEILELLGTPNRSNEEYLYYTILQKRLGIWPLHTKTMVIKFLENDSIDWIKIHE